MNQLSTEFPDRLVTLCDGRPGLRGGLHMEVHDVGPVPSPGASSEIRDNSCNSCLDFVSSDETLDRYDEIISASGWRLENYQRNPIFQNAHKYGDIIFTLGKALVTEVRSGKLFQRIEFATDINPMAKIAYGLYKGKFLNAVSVGFIPLKWENGPPTNGKDAVLTVPNQNSAPQQFRRRYIEQELLEVSAVGIPANPNALALGLKAGAIEKSDLQDTLDLLRALTRSDTSYPSYSSDPSKLLSLSRTLRDLMRRI